MILDNKQKCSFAMVCRMKRPCFVMLICLWNWNPSQENTWPKQQISPPFLKVNWLCQHVCFRYATTNSSIYQVLRTRLSKNCDGELLIWMILMMILVKDFRHRGECIWLSWKLHNLITVPTSSESMYYQSVAEVENPLYNF